MRLLFFLFVFLFVFLFLLRGCGGNFPRIASDLEGCARGNLPRTASHFHGCATVRYGAPHVRWVTRNLWLLSITSLLNDISSEMIAPLLPLYLVAVLGSSKGFVGLVEGAAEATGQVLRVFVGAWSDRLARRKSFTIVGYAQSAVGKLVLALAASPWQVLGARVLDRLGKAIRTAPRDALIAESVDASLRGRAFGLHKAFDNFGAVLGVVVALLALQALTGGASNGVPVAPTALIASSAPNADLPAHDAAALAGPIRTILWWALLPAALGIACLFLVRESPTTTTPAAAPSSAPSSAPTRPTMLGAWRALDPRARAYLWVLLLFTLGNSSNAFLLLRAQSLGCSVVHVVALYLAYNVVATLASYPAGKLSDSLGRRRVLVVGFIVSAVVYLGMAATAFMPADAAIVALWVLFPLYGFYSALTEGVEKALLIDLSPPQLKATVLGLNSMIVGLGLLPASLVAGVLWDTLGPAAPFALGGATSAVAAVALWRVLRGA